MTFSDGFSETVWKIQMGTTEGSHESAKLGEKCPYYRFAPPKHASQTPLAIFQTVSLGIPVNKA